MLWKQGSFKPALTTGMWMTARLVRAGGSCCACDDSHATVSVATQPLHACTSSGLISTSPEALQILQNSVLALMRGLRTGAPSSRAIAAAVHRVQQPDPQRNSGAIELHVQPAVADASDVTLLEDALREVIVLPALRLQKTV